MTNCMYTKFTIHQPQIKTLKSLKIIWVEQLEKGQGQEVGG